MRWLAAGLVLLVAACGGGKATNNNGASNNTSLTQSRLTQAETRAAGFAKSGDYQNAARQYAEALRIATTLENAEAIAANAINLSIVSQWLGRDNDARAALDAVLADSHTAFSERRKIQAELRRAIVELGGGNTGAAAIWAGQAQSRCNATSCEYAAGILNVRAQIELVRAQRGSGTARAERSRAIPLERQPGRTGKRAAYPRARALCPEPIRGGDGASQAGARDRPRRRGPAQDPGGSGGSFPCRGSRRRRRGSKRLQGARPGREPRDERRA